MIDNGECEGTLLGFALKLALTNHLDNCFVIKISHKTTI